MGWDNTYDGYYNGQVVEIITNVIAGLSANASRRFAYVEQVRWVQRTLAPMRHPQHARPIAAPPLPSPSSPSPFIFFYFSASSVI